jgi:elongation factor G
MRAYPLENYRNIGFIAHISAGKTTTITCILYYTGKIHKIGELEKGTTPLDWMIQERERAITILSAATSCKWKVEGNEYLINIIDTPGHIDFTAEVQRSLRVLDGAIVILDGGAGVQSQTETVWRQAENFSVPRIFFVNKMDKPGATFEMNLESIEKKLTKDYLPLQLPVGEGSDFCGLIDLVEMKFLRFEGKEGEIIKKEEIPKDYLEKSQILRKKILEKVCSEDDELLEKYLEDKEIGVDELKKAIRKATVKNKIFPVLFGSLFKRIGIQTLLDAICYYLPSPSDLPAIKGIDPKTQQEISRKPSDNEPFSALVFKTQLDPYVGMLTFFRIYSGKLKKGDFVLNTITQQRERIGRILRMHADQKEELEEGFTGDILATVGLKDTFTGHTLADEQNPIILEKASFPEPVISIRIEPKTKGDQEKLALALKKFTQEDPTFKVKVDEETGQTLISGMGELHLEIILDRMKREFKLEANIGKPEVAYKETITKTVEAEGKYIRQSGGRGQYGHCVIRLEPLKRGSGFEFVNAIKYGIIPKEFIPAIEKGVREGLEKGVLAGYPMTDIKCTVFDGSFHEVDSSELAFKLAGQFAFLEGAKKANPILLEPIMKAEVIIPEEYLGEVLADLTRRRGKIEEVKETYKTRIILAKVPLAEMFGYATDLRSLTQGRGSFTMEFDHYEEVPPSIQEEIVGKKEILDKVEKK